MTAADKAQMRLNCLYAAISITGVNSANSSITKGEKETPRKRPTTEGVMAEAQKLTDWVFEEKK